MSQLLRQMGQTAFNAFNFDKIIATLVFYVIIAFCISQAVKSDLPPLLPTNTVLPISTR